MEKAFEIIKSNHEDCVWPDSRCSLLPLPSTAHFGLMGNEEVEGKDERIGGGHVWFQEMFCILVVVCLFLFWGFFFTNTDICINIMPC